MSYTVSANHGPEAFDMRKAYVDALMEMAEKNKRVIVMEADLMFGSGTQAFRAKYPAQFVECGIQESNMIGVACGLSSVGYLPFVHTFAPFITRRTCDQIMVSGALAKQNVRLLGSDPGVSASFNGGTHMPFEDVGIMRGIPGMTVIDATDSALLRDVLLKTSGVHGMFYIRMIRKSTRQVYEAGSEFQVGKANVLREGKDATIIASGMCVTNALDAAQMLAAKGVEVRVLDMFTIKPVDQEAVIRAAKETGAIVTAENHNIYNGLRSAVAEVLAENYPAPMESVGVKDRFGQVGPVDFLMQEYELTGACIADKVLEAIKRK